MKLSQEDHAEILANARLVNWKFSPALVKGPDGWRLRENGIGPLVEHQWKQERLDRKRRAAGLGRHPIWTGEQRPEGFVSFDVESTLPSRILSEAELRKFCSLAFSRASDVIGAQEFYPNTHVDPDFEPESVRLPRSESAPFEDVVSDALRKLPTIKRMLDSGRESQVTELTLILTYGISVEEGVERLRSVGLATSKPALKKRLQRLREQLKQTRFSPARIMIMRFARRAPEGTKTFLLGIARALGMTFDELNQICKAGPYEPKFQRHQFERRLDQRER